MTIPSRQEVKGVVKTASVPVRIINAQLPIVKKRIPFLAPFYTILFSTRL